LSGSGKIIVIVLRLGTNLTILSSNKEKAHGGHNMKSVKNYLILGLLFLFGIYLIVKAYTLYAIFINKVDGEGIGIFIGFLEINDRCPKELIPVYATFFTIIGIAFITLPVLIKIWLAKR